MCRFQALLRFPGPSATGMANTLSREVRIDSNMVQSKDVLNTAVSELQKHDFAGFTKEEEVFKPAFILVHT